MTRQTARAKPSALQEQVMEITGEDLHREGEPPPGPSENSDKSKRFFPLSGFLPRPSPRAIAGWTAAIVGCGLAIAAFSLIYGDAMRKTALAAARSEADRRAALEIGALVADVDKFRLLPRVLVELQDARDSLDGGSPGARARLDQRLADLARDTEASALYGIDSAGVARVASNADQPDSFVGYSFRFRPYFVDAMRTGGSEYFAEGAVTGRTGLFLARRVEKQGRPLGVIVVKIEFDQVERLWRAANRVSFIADPDGVIIVSTEPELKFDTLTPLDAARRAEIARARPFGDARLDDAGIRLSPDGQAVDAAGRRYIATVTPLPILGWRHVHLERLEPALTLARDRTRLATLLFAIGLTGLAALVWWSATRQRRQAQARLALEDQVSRRTAELSAANAELRRQAEERERADRLYRAAREELAQANRLGSIGTITTSVAHEINQPVATIRAAAENATKLMDLGRPETAADNMRLIVRMTQRIGSITSELLRYARRGRQGAAPVSVNAIVDGVLVLIGHGFRSANVRLLVERDETEARVLVSQIRAEQVLVNLLQNALAAVRECPDPTVRLDVSCSGDEVRIRVSDNGPGVPTALGESIFQPFVTGRPEGTGLGLGISREIVAEYGGTLVLTASPIGGAAFLITLPALPRTDA